MKKRVCCLVLALLMLCAGALAENLINGEYTDVPSVMTQDAVVDMQADQDCTVTLLQPDAASTQLLEKVYSFVWHEKNRPVRFYDEETQQKIQALLPGIDIDVLHMTEFMAQEMQGAPQQTVLVQRLLDVDYQPGQLVVVVLGIEEENGVYRWFPYLGTVPSTGLITYEIPAEDFACLTGKRVIYHVLTNRIGARGNILTHYEIINERRVLPSKSAEDITRIRRWYSENGETLDDSFSIFLVDKTAPMLREISRIGEFLAEGHTAIEWFPAEIASQAQLLLADKKAEELIIYDVVAVMAKDYIDTYGDVACESIFASAYPGDCGLVAMLGFPIEQAQEAPYFDWYCLRAETAEEAVEIVFKQLVIPQMEAEPAMLMILSQPIGE